MSDNVNSGSTYVIVNIKSGTVIDLSAGDNKTVTGWAHNGGSNQSWTMNWTGSGWTFKNGNTGTYLSIQGAPGNGVPLTASSTAFEWDIWRDSMNPNTFRIFVPNTIQNLDLYDYGSPNSGDPITLWATWAGLHQTWSFNPA